MKKMILSFIVFTMLLVAFVPARGPNAEPGSTPSSQDQICDRAERQMEINQGSAEKYQKADALLNELYSKLIRRFQTDIKEWTQKRNADQTLYETKGLEELRAAETASVQYRDLHCDAARQRMEGGSMSPMVWADCVTDVTTHRIEELKSAYELESKKVN
jgi:uncharacterized protein YecT (DUF1311 family)